VQQPAAAAAFFLGGVVGERICELHTAASACRCGLCPWHNTCPVCGRPGCSLSRCACGCLQAPFHCVHAACRQHTMPLRTRVCLLAKDMGCGPDGMERWPPRLFAVCHGVLRVCSMACEAHPVVSGSGRRPCGVGCCHNKACGVRACLCCGVHHGLVILVACVTQRGPARAVGSHAITWSRWLKTSLLRSAHHADCVACRAATAFRTAVLPACCMCCCWPLRLWMRQPPSNNPCRSSLAAGACASHGRLAASLSRTRTHTQRLWLLLMLLLRVQRCMCGWRAESRLLQQLVPALCWAAGAWWQSCQTHANGHS
jgi:hypothetical protein